MISRTRIIRRAGSWLGNTLLVLFGVSLLAFVLTYLTPGDLAENMLTSQGAQPTGEMIALMRERLGLDRPLWEQYFNWLGRLLQGDLGVSFSNGTPIMSDFAARLPLTLGLTVAALACTWLIAVPVALFAASRPGRPFDAAVRLVSYVGSAVPAFLIGLLVLQSFGVQLHLFPIAATQDLVGMIMPTLTLTLAMVGWYIRQVRAIALEEFDRPYIGGLRIRGMSRARICLHVLRNIAAPLCTLGATSFGALLAGSAVVEAIFSWKGIGNYALAAITAKDYPVIQAYVLWCAVVFLIANTVADLLAFVLDPRLSDAPAAKRNRHGSGDDSASIRIQRPDLTSISVTSPPRYRRRLLPKLSPLTAWLVLAGILAVIGAVALLADAIAPQDPYVTSVAAALQPPGAEHWLGTDNLGRDVFSRVVVGLRPTLSVAVTVVCCALVLGTIVGVVSALLGGAADAAIQRLTAVFQSFPEFILALAFASMLGPGFVSAVAALTLASWTGIARYARVLTLQIRQAPYVQAARMNGVPGVVIFLRHMVPNIGSPLLVMAASGLGSVILNLATLSFVGLGLPQPTSEWGTMISDGRPYLQIAPWLLAGPGIALFLVTLAVNLFADASQDVLAVNAADPKTQRESPQNSAAEAESETREVETK